MKKTVYYILPLFIFLTLLSCNQRKDAEVLLYKAQSIMETSPDSALMLLDSLKPNVSKLDKNHRMQYETAMVMAMYENKKDITKDTSIFEARRYFLKTDDYKQQTLASLYSGIVYRKLEKYDKAMEAYKEASYSAVLTGDSSTMGRIHQGMAYLYTLMGYEELSLHESKMACNFFQNRPNNAAENMNNIGRYYTIFYDKDSSPDYIDSALYYFKEGLEKAEKYQTKWILYTNIGLTHLDLKQYDEAEKCFKLALSNAYHFDTLSVFAAKYCLTKTLFLSGNTDSLEYYIQELKNDISDIADANLVKTTNLVSDVFQFLSEYHAANNQYDSAYAYCKKHLFNAEKNHKMKQESSVYEIQKKYDFEAEQNRYNIMLLKRQHKIVVLTVSLLILSIIVIFFVLRLMKNRKKEAELVRKLLSLERKNTELHYLRNDLENEMVILKQEQIKLEEQNNKQIDEDKIYNIQQQITELKSRLEQTTSQLKEKEKDIKKLKEKIRGEGKKNTNDGVSFEEKMQKLLSEPIFTELFSKTDKAFIKIGSEYPELQLSERQQYNIIQAVDKVFRNFTKNLLCAYPQLKKSDMIYCCLFFVGLEEKQISALMGRDYSTVCKRKQKLQKIFNNTERISSVLMEIAGKQ